MIYSVSFLVVLNTIFSIRGGPTSPSGATLDPHFVLPGLQNESVNFILTLLFLFVLKGGESRVETHFNYIDYTQQIREAARRAEEERLAEERRRREAEERQRIEIEREERIEFERQCYLAEQEEIRLAEELSLILELERLELERQKKRELEEKAASERSALLNYKLGNRAKSQNIRRLNLNKLRIGVFGPTGSGKSCFINTCERTVLQTDKGSVPIATSGSEGTIVLEDYLSQMFFRLVDTRGFFSYDHHEGREMTDIMYGRIKSGDPIRRERTTQIEEGAEEVPLEEWLHGVVLVVKSNDVRLRNGSLEMYLKPMRDILHAVGKPSQMIPKGKLHGCWLEVCFPI